MGPTNDNKLTTQHILQRLQITQRLNNHPEWPNNELNIIFLALSPQQDIHANTSSMRLQPNFSSSEGVIPYFEVKFQIILQIISQNSVILSIMINDIKINPYIQNLIKDLAYPCLSMKSISIKIWWTYNLQDTNSYNRYNNICYLMR